jgi:hypothetical protein
MKSVYCAVRTGSLTKAVCASNLNITHYGLLCAFLLQLSCIKNYINVDYYTICTVSYFFGPSVSVLFAWETRKFEERKCIGHKMFVDFIYYFLKLHEIEGELSDIVSRICVCLHVWKCPLLLQILTKTGLRGKMKGQT